MSKNKTVRKTFLTAFCFFVFAGYTYAENCYTFGLVQYNASGCDTIERTCCSATKAWSDWGEACPTCSSEQCWNGSECIDKGKVTRPCLGNIANSTGGTQTRTAACKLNSGWNYGSWSGTCTCKSGYKWYASSSSCLSNYKLYKSRSVLSGKCDAGAVTSIEAAKRKSDMAAARDFRAFNRKGQYGIPREDDCTSEGFISLVIADYNLYVDCQNGTYQSKYTRDEYFCVIR